MAEKNEIKFKAENGQILIARDEVQAAAFKKAGLEQVDKKQQQEQQQKTEE